MAEEAVDFLKVSENRSTFKNSISKLSYKLHNRSDVKSNFSVSRVSLCLVSFTSAVDSLFALFIFSMHNTRNTLEFFQEPISCRSSGVHISTFFGFF